MITGISGFGFFLVQKSPFRDAYLFFKNVFAETPIFIVFLGARFLGQVVKKGHSQVIFVQKLNLRTKMYVCNFVWLDWNVKNTGGEAQVCSKSKDGSKTWEWTCS